MLSNSTTDGPFKQTEVSFDYNRNVWVTRHQQDEIDKLTKEIKTKKTDRVNSLRGIIGYFYKKR